MAKKKAKQAAIVADPVAPEMSEPWRLVETLPTGSKLWERPSRLQPTEINTLGELVEYCVWQRDMAANFDRSGHADDPVCASIVCAGASKAIAASARLRKADRPVLSEPKTLADARRALNMLIDWCIGNQTATKEDGPWSQPKSPKDWARLFDVEPGTFLRWRKNGKIRAKEITERRICVHVDDMPKKKT